MQLRPEDRYKTVADLSADLERWLANEPLTAFRETWLSTAARLKRKNPTAYSLGVVSTVLLIGSALGQWVQGEKDRRSLNDQKMIREGNVLARKDRDNLATAFDAELRGDWKLAAELLRDGATWNTKSERRLLARALFNTEKYHETIQCLDVKSHGLGPWEFYFILTAMAKDGRINEACEFHNQILIRLAAATNNEFREELLDEETKRFRSEAMLLLKLDVKE